MRAYDIVKTFTNELLRKMVKELRVISNADAPAKLKYSKPMNSLFKAEKKEWSYWSDQYHNVDSAVKTEIMRRIENDLM